MTLKISRFLTDAIAKQAKISHFDYTVDVGKPSDLNVEWKEKIQDQFGEIFLNDANYLFMAEIPDADDKTLKKFSELLATVLDTEVSPSEVKQLQKDDASRSPDGDDADDNDEEAKPQASSTVYLVKVTTK